VFDAGGRNPPRLTDTSRKPSGEVGNSAAPASSPDGQYLASLRRELGLLGDDKQDIADHRASRLVA